MMTIEDLRKEWETVSKEPMPLWETGMFAVKYMNQLLAVAEAAQPLGIKTSFNKDSWTQVDELNQRLKDLLEDNNG